MADSDKNENKPAAKPKKAKRQPGFYVCKGKSVTSKKGIQDAGNKVDGSFFPGGKERVAELVDADVLEEQK